MTKKITLEIPSTMQDEEVKEWVRVVVERHLTAIEKAKVTSVAELVAPHLVEYDTKNNIRQVVEKEVVEEIVNELER